jgi:hypothetical protein
MTVEHGLGLFHAHTIVSVSLFPRSTLAREKSIFRCHFFASGVSALERVIESIPRSFHDEERNVQL